jgi:hypothetical protein
VSNAEVVNDGNIAKEIAYDPHMGRVLGGGSSVTVIDGHATTRQFAAAALSVPSALRRVHVARRRGMRHTYSSSGGHSFHPDPDSFLGRRESSCVEQTEGISAC